MPAMPAKKHVTIELEGETEFQRTIIGSTGQEHHDRTSARGDFHFASNQRREYHQTIERIVRENSAD